MIEALRSADLFAGLSERQMQAVAQVAKPAHLAGQEILFLLGDAANALYVVVEGKMELRFPLPLGDEVREITIETLSSGEALGWSSLVRPYRFTLTARAAEPCLLASLARAQLVELFESDPRLGYLLSSRISEVVGLRLMAVQALWVRGLQRALEAEALREKT